MGPGRDRQSESQLESPERERALAPFSQLQTLSDMRRSEIVHNGKGVSEN
jgi:hypothetical protein